MAYTCDDCLCDFDVQLLDTNEGNIESIPIEYCPYCGGTYIREYLDE